LVQRDTAYAYGAAESSYRPQEFGEFREDYRFTGKEDDVEVGLIYFGARYYAPLLQRWISADPLAVHAPGAADLNLYAYVSGRTLIVVDPVGLNGSSQSPRLESYSAPNPPADFPDATVWVSIHKDSPHYQAGSVQIFESLQEAEDIAASIPGARIFYYEPNLTPSEVIEIREGRLRGQAREDAAALISSVNAIRDSIARDDGSDTGTGTEAGTPGATESKGTPGGSPTGDPKGTVGSDGTGTHGRPGGVPGGFSDDPSGSKRGNLKTMSSGDRFLAFAEILAGSYAPDTVNGVNGGVSGGMCAKCPPMMKFEQYWYGASIMVNAAASAGVTTIEVHSMTAVARKAFVRDTINKAAKHRAARGSARAMWDKKNLAQHTDHIPDFGKSTTTEQYSEKAYRQLQNAMSGNSRVKLDSDRIRVYNRSNGTFGVYNFEGEMISFFRRSPKGAAAYWRQQPGVEVMPRLSSRYLAKKRRRMGNTLARKHISVPSMRLS